MDERREGDTKAVEEGQAVVSYVHSTNLPEFFRAEQCSLAVTTYQAQRVLFFSAGSERLSMLMRVFERPTGLAVDGRRLALCTKRMVWFFEDTGKLRSPEGQEMDYDVCYAPRRSHVTGDIQSHEICWYAGAPLVVNTRFSCLCRIDPAWSFVPIWRPKFISAIAAQDRCHLNGLCVDARGPCYVTALGETDTPEGWRENKREGGCLIDVKSGEVICRGLSMPHSPRIHGGHLWLLDSGRGELDVVEPQSGRLTTIGRFRGYLRGLSFLGNYAFVGLSKIREKRHFGGLDLEKEKGELECAVYVLNVTTGRQEGVIQFTKGIEELFSVCVIPKALNPHIIGFHDDTVDGVFVFPEQ